MIFAVCFMLRGRDTHIDFLRLLFLVGMIGKVLYYGFITAFLQDVKFLRMVIHRSKFRRMDCRLNRTYFKHGELRCESVKNALK